MAKITDDIDFSQDKSSLIPTEYIEFIFGHCPEAGDLYCFLWKNKDHKNRVILLKEEIPSRVLMHRHAFNSKLRKLCREGLASLAQETPTMLLIEITGWSDEDMP